MNQIRPLRMIPRQAAPGRLGLHIRPIQDQPHPVQNDINERCQPKFWQIFFILQTIFTIFFLDIAFSPLLTYACDPYNGLSWNPETNSTYRDRACHGHGQACWAKQEACLLNCEGYTACLKEMQDLSSASAYRAKSNEKTSFKRRGLYPNPLCFYWDSHWNMNAKDPNLPGRIFNEKKQRATEQEKQRTSAYFWNYTSYIILLVWFIIFCTSSGDEFMTSGILFIICMWMYFIGNYIAFKAISTLKCYHQQPIYNETTWDTIGYEYKLFCDDYLEDSKINVSMGKEMKLKLPPIPKTWAIPHFILGIRATVPLVYILIWAIRAAFGPQIFSNTATSFTEVILQRFWAEAQRRH